MGRRRDAAGRAADVELTGLLADATTARRVEQATGHSAEVLESAPLLEPAGREQWRRWLLRYAATGVGAWVMHGIDPGAPLRYDDLIEEALCFGWVDLVSYRRLVKGYIVRLVAPCPSTMTWSDVHRLRIRRMRARGLMTRAGEAAVERAQSTGRWSGRSGPSIAQP